MMGKLGSIKIALRGFLTLSRKEQLHLILSKMKQELLSNILKVRKGSLQLRYSLLSKLSDQTSADRLLFRSPEFFCTPELIVKHIETAQPARLNKLVQIALEETNDPQILMALAGHPLSRPAITTMLAAERIDNHPQISKKLQISANYAAGFVAATALTADNRALDNVRARLPAQLTDRYQQVLESWGCRPAEKADPALRGIRESGLRTHKHHRLIIAETLDSGADFMPLLVGADQVTLIGLNDTFGKSSVTEMSGRYGLGEISVEHIRSRLTRFSKEYITLHLQTRDQAKQLSKIMAEAPDILKDDERPFLELSLADFLFFQALKLKAVSELFSDSEFDHIVIAIEDQSTGSSFLQTLSGIKGLTTDPRVELISVSRSIDKRAAFAKSYAAILSGPFNSSFDEKWLPSPESFAASLESIANSAHKEMVISLSKNDARPNILLVTRPNPAYDHSVANYISSLSKDTHVDVHFIGRNAIDFHSLLESACPNYSSKVNISLFPDQKGLPIPAMNRWLTGKIRAYAATQPIDDPIAHMTRVYASHISSELFYNIILRARVLDIYFTKLQKEAGRLPSLVIQSPGRPPQIALYSAVARRYGVPSLVLEPNALDSRYARYSKLHSDYYGVISQFFRDQAPGFSIPTDRCFVIGTPRIIRPDGHDLSARRRKARDQISQDFNHNFKNHAATVSFFGQPSTWKLVEHVWRGAIQASAKTNIGLLLKPHPEESPSRIQQYMSMVHKLGCSDHVKLVSGAPDEIICASDIVLTGYSTAAIDAAVLGVPVICVTDGKNDYPLPQDQIVGTVLTRSSEELENQFRDFLSRPEFWQARTEAFLQREPQFVSGPDQPLRDLARHIMAQPPEKAIRRAEDLPDSIFLDEPHPTFLV